MTSTPLSKQRALDALEAFVGTIGDESPALHKAFWQLYVALDDIDLGRPHVNHPQHVAARALEKANAYLEAECR